MTGTQTFEVTSFVIKVKFCTIYNVICKQHFRTKTAFLELLLIMHNINVQLNGNKINILKTNFVGKQFASLVFISS